MEVKFLDLKKLNARFQVDFQKNYDDFINSGYYILGSKTKKFETQFSQYCQSMHCIGVANGLDALILIYKALIDQKKMNVGDVVAIQGNTFIASALAAIHCGLKIHILTPRNGYNLSIADVESQITNDVKSLLLVHLYGEMKDTSEIASFCKTKNIILVEDAAQAHGAEWNGKRAGQYGIAAGFSFYPGKNLGALGDAGAIVTNDSELFENISFLRNYGSKVKYHHEKIGFNSRLDEIQAGFLIPKLEKLNEDNNKRQAIFKKYNSQISNPLISTEEDRVQPLAHVHHLYILNTSHRDIFQNFMLKNGIETLIHYPFAIFESAPIKAHIVNTFNYDLDRLNRHIISIPISPLLTESETDYIIKTVNMFDGK